MNRFGRPPVYHAPRRFRLGNRNGLGEETEREPYAQAARMETLPGV
jgi:hypothetical protein